MRISNASASSEPDTAGLRATALGILGGTLLPLVFGLSIVWGGPIVSTPAIDQRNGEIVVSAVLEEGLPAEVDREILSGVFRELYYYLVLYQVVPGWYDDEKGARTVRFTVKYDLLTRQFAATRTDDGGTENRVFDTYEEMERWVSVLREVPVGPIRVLSRKHSYRVAVKAEMKAGEPPALLKYMLFFVPYSHFGTPWADSRVFRRDDLK